MYNIKEIKLALEEIMDDGWGKPFNKFSNEEKEEVVNAVIRGFKDDGLFILRGKYVICGKSGVLKADHFCNTKTN